MRWNKNYENRQINDSRGNRGRGYSGGGRGLLSIVPLLFRFLGFKGTAIVGIIGAVVYFINPGLVQSLLGMSPSSGSTQQIDRDSVEDKQSVLFIKNTMGSVDAIWTKLLGNNYRKPNFNLISDTQGMGPYYMPSNETIYLDPQFFNDLSSKYNAPGDFAHAYVIAHEGAHHIQKLLGFTDFVHQQHGKKNYNQLSVRLELYADFLAGVWAHNAVKNQDFTFENGDVEEAIRAANAIGDDALQKKAGAWKIDPSKFTHGTSAQRQAWLLHGLKSGDFRDCDLFLMDRYGNISTGGDLLP